MSADSEPIGTQEATHLRGIRVADSWPGLPERGHSGLAPLNPKRVTPYVAASQTLPRRPFKGQLVEITSWCQQPWLSQATRNYSRSSQHQAGAEGGFKAVDSLNTSNAMGYESVRTYFMQQPAPSQRKAGRPGWVVKGAFVGWALWASVSLEEILDELQFNALISEAGNNVVHNQELRKAKQALLAWRNRAVDEAVAGAEKQAEYRWKREHDYWKTLAESFLRREQTRLPEKQYMCNNPVCSSLHTAAEIEQLTAKQGGES